MKFHVISDLHLEFAPFEVPKVEADVTILAGDVHKGLHGLNWALRAFPDRMVIYVLGNHEFYGQNLQRLVEELREKAAGTNVRVLENDSVDFGDVKVLGTTLWTDFDLNGDRLLSQTAARMGMNDYRSIRTLPRYSRLKPAETRNLHQKALLWIKAELSAAPAAKKLIVTHHAPSPRSLDPCFQGSTLNPAYASNLDQLVIESKARYWIHGHIHTPSNYVLGETMVIANPRGYPDQTGNGFDPGLVVEV